ncbi:MerR family transcriptional regulator [Paenibacillus dakarensis]|uniref:MerR family transcriptional regulator n=1 Tax=Paenibacillus dakarensis TaxID=1527293 RepID=UPI0006D55F26|nr:MerR family transcriptional regulator [Paenibacillus dakarensis]
MSYTYTIEELSRMSGLSVEMLQYYNQSGLLSPSDKDDHGIFLYGQRQLLDLQQIMLLREQLVPLSEIKVMMDEKKQNHTEALLLHKERLIEKQRRIQSLVNTIDNTINYVEQHETPVAAQRLYEGFDLALQDEYAGVKDATQQQWTKEDYLDTQREADQIYLDLCNALESGKDPGSPSVQKTIHRHYEWVSRFYTPTKEIYAGLGDIYVEHEDFRQLYAGYHPQLAEYLREGMKIYAEEQI